jgi:hypothetical protein
LYFSPTLLLDDDEDEVQQQPIQTVLSTIDQNQKNQLLDIDIEKPKIISRRLGKTFVLDNIKIEEINKSYNTENLRPHISDEIPFIIINPNPSQNQAG